MKTDSDNTDSFSDENSDFGLFKKDSKFIYMPVKVNTIKIAALIDCGSSINIISNQFYTSIPQKCKSNIFPVNEKIILANNQSVSVIGKANIKIQVPQGKHWIISYILSHSSHPLILGTDYLTSKKIVLDFGELSAGTKSINIKSQKQISVDPQKEILVWGKAPNNLLYGQQGMCTNSAYIVKNGLWVAKAVVNVNKNRTVPLRIFNPTNDTIVIPRGKVLSVFHSFNSDFHLVNTCTGNSVQNVELQSDSFQSEAIFDSKFMSYFDIPDHLSDSQKRKLISCLEEHKDLFVTDENPELGYTDLVQHKICLKPDYKSKYQRPYRLTPDKKNILRDHLEELLRQGIIAPVEETEDIPITSPIVLVSKRIRNKSQDSSKSNSLTQFRFCCDFRFLNSQCQNFQYFLPDLNDLTESFSDRKPAFLTSIDLSSGFFQLPIASESQRFTAFNTCFGTYKFLRLPMGLSSAPASMQLLMDKVLTGLTFRSCLCYLDDVLITSETFEKHIEDLNEVFDRLQNAGLKLGPKKCQFAQKSCIFLGHLITKDGLQPPPDRVNAIKEYPAPTTVKELRRLIGLLNWFRKYIPNFSAEIEPLARLLKKSVRFRWTNEQESAFQRLKALLIDSPILAFPRYDIPFYLSVDSSSKGIGYMLYQRHPCENGEENIRVVRFGSKSLTKWQRSYGPTKLELLGMVTAVLDCSMYLRGNAFIVECDHQALKPLFQKQLKGAIYERWIAILQQFNFEVRYKPAREMQVPDALSRIPKETNNDGSESPDIIDPYFPYYSEDVGNIITPEGKTFSNLLKSDSSETELQLNNVNVCAMPIPTARMQLKDKNLDARMQLKDKNLDLEYDGDTEENDCPKLSRHKKRYTVRSNKNCIKVTPPKVHSDKELRILDKTLAEISENSKLNTVGETYNTDKELSDSVVQKENEVSTESTVALDQNTSPEYGSFEFIPEFKKPGLICQLYAPL